MTDNVHIAKVNTADLWAYEGVRNLLSCLYPELTPVSFEKFRRTLEIGQARIFIAVKQDKIIATGSIVRMSKLAGDKWIIEDFIVDREMQHRGIGRQLVNELLKEAQKGGADFVDVDTRDPEANAFYRACEFVSRGENRRLFSLRYKALP